MAEARPESFPLHKAVEHRHVYKIKILLPGTEDINKKDDKGNSVLLLACDLNDNQEILDILLARKDIDVTLANSEGLTALHILSLRGNFEGLVKVLKAFPDVDINVQNNWSSTPLSMACNMNHVRIVELLLAKGADVTIQNGYKQTALHCAANNGHTECVKLLIEYGSEVDATDNYDFTPLIKASKWGFKETCELLIQNGANVNAFSKHMTALSSSCVNNAAELTRLLIAKGANVNFPNHSSALIECAVWGSVECARELIKAGVNVNARMRNGNSAVGIAIERGHMDLARLLSE